MGEPIGLSEVGGVLGLAAAAMGLYDRIWGSGRQRAEELAALRERIAAVEGKVSHAAELAGLKIDALRELVTTRLGGGR